MAQIVTITNPFTGQPIQVDQLEHTAQQIDDAIARALPGGAIDIALAKKANENLLDNWYFANPVNQRGQTEYTGAGYTIDRWMNESDKVVSTLENGLLKLVFSGVTTYMQKVQVPAGIQVTLSVLVENIDGDLFLLWQDIESYTDTHTMKLSKGMNTLTVTTTKQNYRFSIYSSNADTKTISLAGVGLELGDQQTLAHQDADGNWVLNEIPDYGEQLRRCQRYYYRLSATNTSKWARFGNGMVDAYARAEIYLFIPPMRDAPSASLHGAFSITIGSSNKSVDGSELSIVDDNTTNSVVVARMSGSYTSGLPTTIQAYGDANAYIEFTADL